ncbi:uncharacterized protein LOC134280020 isoform X2 [Saccostrea cucullata]|uniref:uncharacterized protein LOC134280020 isoform X2 n=1 Tax=Saccostrea cuccullata TaxID=36930 RepID=UPI002ED4C8F4
MPVCDGQTIDKFLVTLCSFLSVCIILLICILLNILFKHRRHLKGKLTISRKKTKPVVNPTYEEQELSTIVTSYDQISLQP